MTEIESNDEVQFAPDEEAIDPIATIHTGTCESLSGRSDLTWAIGRSTEDGTLHLRITANSGGGIWCRDWVSATAIQDVVLGESGLTAKALGKLQEGRSINGSGFILSSIKALGLVRPNAENTRLHEHVPGTTFEKVVSAAMAEKKGVKPVTVESAGRKTLRVKPKEG